MEEDTRGEGNGGRHKGGERGGRGREERGEGGGERGVREGERRGREGGMMGMWRQKERKEMEEKITNRYAVYIKSLPNSLTSFIKLYDTVINAVAAI